jgi:RNA polymerase sigma-70 factor (ECF subfamily)
LDYRNRCIGSAFSTWVHRVTTNACLDELRRKGRRPRVARRLDAAPERHDGGPRALDPADPAPGADDRLPDRMAIDDALAALPEEFRVAVVLRDHLGLDYAEIAETLDLPAGTVRSRIARGRARLAALLAPETPAPAAEARVDPAPGPGPGNPRPGDGVQGGAR